jgi:uncharacterized protein (TIRG00374 family)
VDKLNRTLRYLFQIILGTTIVAVIFWFIDINSFFDVIQKINYRYVAAAMVVYFLLMCYISIRPKMIFDNLGKKIGFLKVVEANFGSMLASDFTPGRTGFMVFPLLIKKYIPVSTGFSAIFTIQVIDFFMKIVLSLAAIVYVASVTKIEPILLMSLGLAIVIISVFALMMALVLWSNHSQKVVALFSGLPIIGEYAKRFMDKANVFQRESHYVKRIMPQLLIVSFLGAGVKGLEWYFLGTALGFGFSPLLYILLHPLISLVQFIPLTPAGLGLQEGGSLIVLVLLGIPLESALVFSLLGRVDMVLVNLVGLPVLMRKGLSALNNLK